MLIQDMQFDFNNPGDCYLYVYHVLNRKPSPEYEAVIAKSDEDSFLYAHNVLKGPFQAGEAAIARSPRYSYLYALYVINGPFLAGEPAIASSDDFSFSYARDVLYDPYPELWGKRFTRIRGDYDPWEVLKEVG